MKLHNYSLILLTAFAAYQVKAQSNTDRLRFLSGGSKGRQFTVKGVPYQTQIGGEAIASSPDWHFEISPPVDFATATRIARRQLRELVEDEASWQVDEISLCRATTAPGKWYYHIEFGKPNLEPAKRIPLFVDFSGNSGKVWIEKSRVTIWMYTTYEDTLAAIKLCDGVEMGPSSYGIIWSFEGYDAIIAISTDNGKVSGMRYWTRKEYETGLATAATSGQSIIGATFSTKEKKVSVNTTSK